MRNFEIESFFIGKVDISQKQNALQSSYSATF